MMKQLIFTLTVLFTIFTQAITPMLSNFRIVDSEPSKVYFDASTDVTGLTMNGFIINGKTINSVTTSGLGGYFVVTSPFDYWDNNTIRLENGDGTVLDFTLSYIDNQIDEPTAAIDKYVTPTASGGGNGLTEATAWTWEEAFDNVSAGTTVWIKAGDYGDKVLNLFHKHGTVTSPIKFIGYKVSIGDINSNYLMDTDVYTTKTNLNNNFSTAEMPTLTGKELGNRTEDDVAIMLTDVSYVVFRNIQIRKYANGIQNRQGNSNHSSHIIIDRINGYDFIERNYDANLSATYGHFINLEGSHENINNVDFTHSNYCKLTNIVAKGGNLAVIFVIGWGNNLFKNIKLYDEPISNPHADYDTTNKEQSDYYLAVGGSNNIIKDVYTYNYQDWLPTTNQNGDGPGGHGIGIRSSYTWVGIGEGSKYNLIDDCHTLGMTEGLYIRNLKADFNVIKNSSAKRTTQLIGNYPDYYVLNWSWIGVGIWGGVDNNIIENVEITNMSSAIAFVDNHEDEDGIPSSILASEPRLLEIGNNNIFRNIKADGFKNAVKTNSDLESVIPSEMAKMHGNKILNSVFTSGYKLFDPNYSDIDEFKFINTHVINLNNTVEKVIADSDTRSNTDAATFTNCNFYNNISLADTNWLIDNSRVADNNNINVNPHLDFNFKPTANTPTSITEGGLTTVDCQFDYDNNERTTLVSIGAYEYDTETLPTDNYVTTEDFKVYPNPTRGSFIIEFKNSSFEKKQITISDVSGRLVYANQTTKDENKLIINQKINSGVYFIKIKNKTKIFIQKIIIK